MVEAVADYIGHRRRMRERFLKNEGRDMADYELLEIVLMQAIPRRDVKPLAKMLIRTFGSFAGVVSAPEYKLRAIKGISDASIVMIKIAKVTAQRISWENLASDDLPVLFNTDNLIDYYRSVIGYAEIEELHILYLDVKLRIIASELLQRGSIASVVVSPREVARLALNKNAAGIIMIHNHPSGSAKPSENDKVMTKKIEQSCEAVNIKLHEHIIVTKSEYFSFAQHHLISSK